MSRFAPQPSGSGLGAPSSGGRFATVQLGPADELADELVSFKAPLRTPEEFFWGFHHHIEALHKSPERTATLFLAHRAAHSMLASHGAPIVASEAFHNVGAPYDYYKHTNLGNYGPHVSGDSCEVRVEIPPHRQPLVTDEAFAEIARAAEAAVPEPGFVERTSNAEKEALFKDAKDAAAKAAVEASPEFKEATRKWRATRVRDCNVLFPLLARAVLHNTTLDNTRGLGAYVHAIMHDESAALIPCMITERLEHENTIYGCGKYTFLDLTFFGRPPLDANDKLIDTRTPNMFKREEREDIAAYCAAHGVNAGNVLNPHFETDVRKQIGNGGVRIVVHYSCRYSDERLRAYRLWRQMEDYLQEHGVVPDEMAFDRSRLVFDGKFYVLFKLPSSSAPSASSSEGGAAPAAAAASGLRVNNNENDGDQELQRLLSNIGRVFAYLMLNRMGLDVSILSGDVPENDAAFEAAAKQRFCCENMPGYSFMSSKSSPQTVPDISGRQVSWKLVWASKDEKEPIPAGMSEAKQEMSIGLFTRMGMGFL